MLLREAFLLRGGHAMRVIPVLDIRDGVAVHAVAGNRQHYRPVAIPGLGDARPLELARWYRDQFGLDELYLADLNAIAGDPPAVDIYSDLRAAGFRLLVDPGIRSVPDVRRLIQQRSLPGRGDGIVVGLESVTAIDELPRLAREVGESRAIFSMDLADGRLLTRVPEFQELSPEGLFSTVIAAGFRRLIVLDLRRVGVGRGTGTTDLCARFHALNPEIEILAGGGVRNAEDLRALGRSGCSAALVASALHDGRLTRGDLHDLEQNRPLDGGL